MARAATETQQAGLTGLEYGLAIPGTVGGAVWANAGAHGSDTAAVLESATVLLADGTEAVLPAAELGFSLPPQPLQGRGAGGGQAGGDRPGAPCSASGPPTRPRSRRAWTTSARWRREHQPLGIPSAGSRLPQPAG